MKFLWPILAFVIAGDIALIAFSCVASARRAAALVSKTVNIAGDRIVIASPHLSGRFEKDGSYEIDAGRATQTIDNPKRVELRDVEARIRKSGIVTTRITSSTGVLDESSYLVVLIGNVQIEAANTKTPPVNKLALDTRSGVITAADLNGQTVW